MSVTACHGGRGRDEGVGGAVAGARGDGGVGVVVGGSWYGAMCATFSRRAWRICRWCAR